ncbi:hypothetical protein BDZ90DRAFT_137109 [Jaminaea rosea]|uniref:Uncharacterized protein n=1 Tax=Jaminaea rosea TaxID=1569628 RepID=A0A316UVK1_9BASI|nr:hypothetical protein BDZ90DRAFT_137109 [Jaminaea rosea]PWN29024.1 hypothetical protein BDZ90DRAFT_137109 [Jaminaea rosea]
MILLLMMTLARGLTCSLLMAGWKRDARRSRERRKKVRREAVWSREGGLAPEGSYSSLWSSMMKVIVIVQQETP